MWNVEFNTFKIQKLIFVVVRYWYTRGNFLLYPKMYPGIFLGVFGGIFLCMLIWDGGDGCFGKVNLLRVGGLDCVGWVSW